MSDHALLLSNLFTAGRIGDYIESSARRGTERGLKYKVGANKNSSVRISLFVEGMVLKNRSLRCCASSDRVPRWFLTECVTDIVGYTYRYLSKPWLVVRTGKSMSKCSDQSN